MAKPSRPTPLRLGPLSELGEKYSAQRDAMRKRGLDDLQRPAPTTLELIAVCKFLLDHPDHIEEPWDRYVLPILKKWLGKIKPPKGVRNNAKAVAKLVDLVDVEKTPDSQLRARKWVAKTYGIPFETVKQAHNRYRDGT
jgi:hypothetical protein